jgi:MATE family multidrug resistance protein
MESPVAPVVFDPTQEGSFRYHFWESIRLAWPIILSQLSQTSVQLADAIFVGNTGSVDALATISFANSVFIIPLVAGIGLSMGLTPVVSQSIGEGRPPSYIGKLLVNSLFLNALVGIGLSVVLIGLIPLIPYFGQDVAVARMSGPVMAILAGSLIPVMLYQALRQWLEGQGMTNPPMWISVAGNLINILLNWVLVYGHWGAPAMGVVGSATASLLARVLMVVAMAVLILILPKVKSNLPKNYSWESSLILRLGKMGLPVGLQLFFEVGAFAFAAIMVGWLGAIPLSAHQIAIAVASFTYMGASGLSSAGTVRVGYYYGAKRALGLEQAAKATYLLGLGYMVVAALILVATHQSVPYLFFPTADVAEPAAILLLFAALFQVADGAQVVGLGVLRGMGDVRKPTLIAIFAYWFMAIPIGYALGIVFGYGANGVWIGLTLGLFVAAIALYQRYRKLYKETKKAFTLKFDNP